MTLSSDQIHEFQGYILNWYSQNGREYSWRKTLDPYKILISEFLLQKTNVRKVEEIYNQFVGKYSTVGKLALAEKSHVIEIIRPLGFLNRACRMIQAAERIMNDYEGRIPASYDELISFTGVGRYIATAVMVFAFNEKRVVVDTNVVKVLGRDLQYFSDKKRPRTDNDLWSFAQSLAPDKNIKEFNWGLLDYGASL